MSGGRAIVAPLIATASADASHGSLRSNIDVDPACAEDLAQYYKDMTPIVQNARVQARQQKVAARKQLVSQTGAVEAAHQAVTAQVIGKLS